MLDGRRLYHEGPREEKNPEKRGGNSLCSHLQSDAMEKRPRKEGSKEEKKKKKEKSKQTLKDASFLWTKNGLKG